MPPSVGDPGAGASRWPAAAGPASGFAPLSFSKRAPVGAGAGAWAHPSSFEPPPSTPEPEGTRQGSAAGQPGEKRRFHKVAVSVVVPSTADEESGAPAAKRRARGPGVLPRGFAEDGAAGGFGKPRFYKAAGAVRVAPAGGEPEIDGKPRFRKAGASSTAVEVEPAEGRATLLLRRGEAPALTRSGGASASAAERGEAGEDSAAGKPRFYKAAGAAGVVRVTGTESDETASGDGIQFDEKPRRRRASALEAAEGRAADEIEGLDARRGPRGSPRGVAEDGAAGSFGKPRFYKAVGPELDGTANVDGTQFDEKPRRRRAGELSALEASEGRAVDESEGPDARRGLGGPPRGVAEDGAVGSFRKTRFCKAAGAVCVAPAGGEPALDGRHRQPASGDSTQVDEKPRFRKAGASSTADGRPQRGESRTEPATAVGGRRPSAESDRTSRNRQSRKVGEPSATAAGRSDGSRASEPADPRAQLEDELRRYKAGQQQQQQQQEPGEPGQVKRWSRQEDGRIGVVFDRAANGAAARAPSDNAEPAAPRKRKAVSLSGDAAAARAQPPPAADDNDAPRVKSRRIERTGNGSAAAAAARSASDPPGRPEAADATGSGGRHARGDKERRDAAREARRSERGEKRRDEQGGGGEAAGLLAEGGRRARDGREPKDGDLAREARRSERREKRRERREVSEDTGLESSRRSRDKLERKDGEPKRSERSKKTARADKDKGGSTSAVPPCPACGFSYAMFEFCPSTGVRHTPSDGKPEAGSSQDQRSQRSSSTDSSTAPVPTSKAAISVRTLDRADPRPILNDDVAGRQQDTEKPAPALKRDPASRSRSGVSFSVSLDALVADQHHSSDTAPSLSNGARHHVKDKEAVPAGSHAPGDLSGASFSISLDALVAEQHRSSGADRTKDASRRVKEAVLPASKRDSEAPGDQSGTSFAFSLDELVAARQPEGGLGGTKRGPTEASSSLLGDDGQSPLVGLNTELEKEYHRGEHNVEIEKVRPVDVLVKSFDHVLGKRARKEADAGWVKTQLKSIRQDLQVQRIENPFTWNVYHTAAEIAIEERDVGELTQCLARLRLLEKAVPDVPERLRMQIGAYRLLFYCLTEDTHGALEEIARQTPRSRKYGCVKHALAFCSALWSSNYSLLAKLTLKAPNAGVALVDLFLPKLRRSWFLMVLQSYRTLTVEEVGASPLFTGWAKTPRLRQFLAAMHAVTSNTEAGLVLDCPASLASFEQWDRRSVNPQFADLKR